jgi:hypothetical protein
MHYAAQTNHARDRIIDREVAKLTARPSPQKFGILATIDGHDVIDNVSGRQVAHRDTAASANGVAQVLNAAAMKGSRALTRALGATD